MKRLFIIFLITLGAIFAVSYASLAQKVDYERLKREAALEAALGNKDAADEILKNLPAWVIEEPEALLYFTGICGIGYGLACK